MLKKIIASLILVGVILASFSACIPEEDSSKEIGAFSKVVSESSSANSTQEKQFASIGEYVQGKKWKIALTNAKLYESIPSGNELLNDTVPENGDAFLVLFFEVENISEEDDFFNYLYFESYVDSYNQLYKILFDKIDGHSLLTGDVAAGKKLSGYLAWEVKNDWSELEVSYKDNLFSSAKSKFRVTPSDIESKSAESNASEVSETSVTSEALTESASTAE